MKTTITILSFLFAFTLCLNAQTFKIEDLAKKTWVEKISMNKFPFYFDREVKDNFNLDNTCHTDICQYDTELKNTATRKNHSIFYLSDTPDKVFDTNKLKNKTGLYIIQQYNETKNVAISKIISLSDTELITEIIDFIDVNIKEDFVEIKGDNKSQKKPIYYNYKGVTKQNLK